METQSLSAITHILQHCPQRIRRLYVRSGEPKTKKRVDEICRLAREHEILIQPFTPERHESGPLKAVLLDFPYLELDEWLESVASKKAALLIALDHVQDPQNFGALCRSAEALGIDGVLIPKDRGVAVSPGVYAASAGAVETIPIVRPVNLGESLRKLKAAGFWIVGGSMAAGSKPPWEMPTFEKVVLVLGAEGEGLSESIEKACDWLVQIPLSGLVESLNVSVAGALLMYEFTRPGRPLAKALPASGKSP